MQFILPSEDQFLLHSIVWNHTLCTSIPTDLGAFEFFWGADTSNSCTDLGSDVLERYKWPQKTEPQHLATLTFAEQELSQLQKKEATRKVCPYFRESGQQHKEITHV